MDVLESKLDALASSIAVELDAASIKCVFAESCTGGKMAAALTRVPGISKSFCGSAVTYREATKTQWLNVAEKDLQTHTAESRFTTVAMAKNVVGNTPEADVSVAITGHLGPGVEATVDGKIFVAIAFSRDEESAVICTEHRLVGGSRAERQTEAACFALEAFLDQLRSCS